MTVTANINKVDDEETLPQILNRFSSWHKMLRVMACFGHLIFIAERDGEGYSISVTSFGVVGERNFLLLFKTGKNGKHH